MLVSELAKQIYPNLAPDRRICDVVNPELWYHIDYDMQVLYVPPMKVLRYDMMQLEKFGEAVVNFGMMDLIDDILYDWDGISFDWPKTEEDTLKAIKKLSMFPKLACDIETRHLRLDHTNAVLSIGFAYTGLDAIAITNFTPAVLSALQYLFESSSITFIWQNGKFDITRLKYLLDLDARVDEDTMLQHFIGINEKKGTHGLKDMASLYLQAPKWDDELQRIKKEYCRIHKILLENFTYDLIPLHVLIPYMLKDCIATFRLCDVYSERMPEKSKMIYGLLVRASNVFAEIELNGFMVDIKHLAKLADELDTQIIDAQRQVNIATEALWNPRQYAIDTGAKAIPSSFNYKSPKQMKWILEKAIGHVIPSADKDALEDLVEEIKTKGESEGKHFIEAFLELRKYNKYLDTYVIGINDGMCSDGRIRCTYNLHGTETGRLSSNEPNMQNIPRNSMIKNIFVARAGYKLVQLDYSQAELRVLAVLSQEPFLLDAYQNDRDIHSEMAIKMFGPNYTKEDRSKCKTLNFGVVYGLKAPNLAYDFNISLTEAQKLLDSWFAPMPVLKRWLADMRRKALRGEECCTPLGRTRHFVLTNDNLFHVQNEFINTPIQSIASDMTLISLINIVEWIQHNCIDARVVATVHDSIIFEVLDDKHEIDQLVLASKRIMAEVPQKYIPNCNVPFKADAEVGYAWGSLDKWQP